MNNIDIAIMIMAFACFLTVIGIIAKIKEPKVDEDV